MPVAIGWGMAYAIPVAVASMLAFNFFFLPPLYTFTLADSRNWFALLVFVVTAVVVSDLAARSRRRARESELLAQVATSLLAQGDVSAELGDIAAEAADALQVERARISVGEQPVTNDAEQYPLVAAGRRVGTLTLEQPRGRGSAARRRLVPALSSLLAVAIDRERLAREALEAETLRRRDAMTTAVLRAVSHDLRSPLMAILTSAGALAREDFALEPERARRARGNDSHRGGTTRPPRRKPPRPLASAGRRAPARAGRLGRRRSRRAGAGGGRHGGGTCRRLVPGRVAGGPGRRAPDPARAGEPDRERAPVLAAGRARAPDSRRRRRRGARARDRPRARDRAGRARADLRAVPPRLGRPRAGRRPRARDRARFRGGERRPRLGRVACGAGRDVRVRAARRSGRRRRSPV